MACQSKRSSWIEIVWMKAAMACSVHTSAKHTQTHTHTNTHTSTSTHTHTHSDTYTHTHSERERKRERERLTDRQTDMQRKKDVPYTSHMQIAERSTKKACWFRYSPVLAVSCVTVHLLALTKWHTDHVSSLQLHHSILCCCRSRRHRDHITRVPSC